MNKRSMGTIRQYAYHNTRTIRIIDDAGIVKRKQMKKGKKTEKKSQSN